MNIIRKNQLAVTIAVAVILCAALYVMGYYAKQVDANPMQISSASKTATATTSPTFMTAGTATTTVTYDSFEINGTNETNNGNTMLPNKAVVLVQFTGSTTAALTDMRIEYSMDNIDWYGTVGTDGFATTTNQGISMSPIASYRFVATGDLAGGQAVVSSTTRRSMIIDVPTRYVRAVFSVPAGSVNSSLWATIVPNKELK